MTASYTKLKNESWGVRVQGAAVKPGQTISVKKQSGEVKSETIEKIVWTGNGVSLCSIKRATAGSTAKPAQRGVCISCGEPCNPNYRKCRDCGMEGGSRYHGGQSYTTRDGRFILGDDD